MAIAPLESSPDTLGSMRSVCMVLEECCRQMDGHRRVLSGREALQLVLDVERASRLVDHLQIVAARLAEEHDLAAPDSFSNGSSAGASEGNPVGDVVGIGAADAPPPGAVPCAPASSGPPSAGAAFRDCADFLRATLGVSRAEAKRRLRLAEMVLPCTSPTGAAVPPRLEVLAHAAGSGAISGRAATIVAQAIERVASFATSRQLESMEHHLTRQAVESDEDILRLLARRWEGVLDQDGQEPTEKVLRARQGVFLKGRRHGLHVLEIGATDEQFEHLVTVMNSVANPRLQDHRTGGAADDASPGSTAGPDTPAGTDPVVRTDSAPKADGTSPTDPAAPTRPQSLLDGLVSACRIALATAALPATGGHRPQVMVTIDYKDLIGQTESAGHAVFAQQISAGSIRQVACDADIIPLVLGGKGEVLDVGRAQRLFPPHLRRALVARDKGCAFPDCSIPASWCEAHHMMPWSRGGSTSIDNGVLLCSRHHHVIHLGAWTVEPQQGIPWFRPPGRPGRAGTARTNTYWQAGRCVDEEVARNGTRPVPRGPGRRGP